jgi:ribosomal-protein-alanine N-acetyltransferase
MLWRVVSGMRGLLGSGQTPESDDLVVGFVGLWFGVDEAHVSAIAVRERWRGLGIGEMLLIGAVELALARQAKVLTLEVRASNHIAQSLYAKYGFKKVGVRKGYYNDNGEDAVIMTTDPLASPAFTELFQRQVKTYRQRRGELVMELPSVVQEATQA